ncbi:hypothetical protein CROQUDRAFT_86162 [Cronartium quercuum f. sp. fusiforme G11]|uniref:Uncharacterized protein n=1 Tax=Cronartium quercuum f. sp. fusiforme G11 TaxID=708437 RepID=A0A9P6NX09_9BASI|nr:hypothetical protein CROQUDRAFT_86162 [Cronartium quercuum f. sp. fusiforme G11]
MSAALYLHSTNFVLCKPLEEPARLITGKPGFIGVGELEVPVALKREEPTDGKQEIIIGQLPVVIGAEKETLISHNSGHLMANNANAETSTSESENNDWTLVVNKRGKKNEIQRTAPSQGKKDDTTLGQQAPSQGKKDDTTLGQQTSARGRVKSDPQAKSHETLEIANNVAFPALNQNQQKKKVRTRVKKDGQDLQTQTKLSSHPDRGSSNKQIARIPASGKVEGDHKTSQQGIQIKNSQSQRIVKQDNETPPQQISAGETLDISNPVVFPALNKKHVELPDQGNPNQVPSTQDSSIVKGTETSQVTSNTEKLLPQTGLQDIEVDTVSQRPDEVPAKHAETPPKTTPENHKSTLHPLVNSDEFPLQGSDSDAKQSTPVPDEGRLGKDSSIQHAENTNQEALTKEKPSDTPDTTEIQEAEPNIEADFDASSKPGETTVETPTPRTTKPKEPESQQAARVTALVQAFLGRIVEIFRANNQKPFLPLNFDSDTLEPLDLVLQVRNVASEQKQFDEAILDAIGKSSSSLHPFEGRRRLYALLAFYKKYSIASTWKSWTESKKMKSNVQFLLKMTSIEREWEVYYSITEAYYNEVYRFWERLAEDELHQVNTIFQRFRFKTQFEMMLWSSELNRRVTYRIHHSSQHGRFFKEEALKNLMKQGLFIPHVLELEHHLDPALPWKVFMRSHTPQEMKQIAAKVLGVMRESIQRTLTRFDKNLVTSEPSSSNPAARWFECPIRMLFFDHPKFSEKLQTRLRNLVRSVLDDEKAIPYHVWIEKEAPVEGDEQNEVKLTHGEVIAATHYGIPLQDLVDVKITPYQNSYQLNGFTIFNFIMTRHGETRPPLAHAVVRVLLPYVA